MKVELNTLRKYFKTGNQKKEQISVKHDSHKIPDQVIIYSLMKI